MFLSRLIYASRAVDSLQTADIEQILEASRRNNGKVGVVAKFEVPVAQHQSIRRRLARFA